MIFKKKKMENIVVSGMRPTGNLHLGNYNAVIKNWLKLQKEYSSLFFVADIHALTTNFDIIYELQKNTKNMIKEWLSCGLNPDLCTIFIQSHVPETLELYTFLSMLVNISRLERIPTYKADKCNFGSYGFLGYPLLQAADVLIFNAKYVPVGEDQVPHIEFIREIVRKINIDKAFEIFNEPQALLYKDSKILGWNGNKMSKSKDNTISILDNGNILKNKINKYITDPNRVYRFQPGNPENCNIWFLHKIYAKKTDQKKIMLACKSAQIGCVECKTELFNKIEKENIKLIKRVKLYEKKEKYINDIIIEGAKKARFIAAETLTLFKTVYKML